MRAAEDPEATPGLAKALAESVTDEHVRGLSRDKEYNKWW
jgi:hypothetical protein